MVNQWVDEWVYALEYGADRVHSALNDDTDDWDGAVRPRRQPLTRYVLFEFPPQRDFRPVSACKSPINTISQKKKKKGKRIHPISKFFLKIYVDVLDSLRSISTAGSIKS